MFTVGAVGLGWGMPVGMDVCGRILKFRHDALMTSTEWELSTSTEFFIVTTLFLIDNTATKGSLTSRIPYGDK